MQNWAEIHTFLNFLCPGTNSEIKFKLVWEPFVKLPFCGLCTEQSCQTVAQLSKADIQRIIRNRYLISRKPWKLEQQICKLSCISRKFHKESLEDSIEIHAKYSTTAFQFRQKFILLHELTLNQLKSNGIKS